MKTLEDYKREIKAATTVDQLHDISYSALKQDTDCTIDDMVDDLFSKRPKGLYNKVSRLCVQKEIELEG